jgi:hypothetical protein
MAATQKRSLLPTNTRRRYTQRQISQRREGVWERLCLGEPIAEMAKHYQVTERTIERDIAWWSERLGLSTDQLKDPRFAAQDVGFTAKKLEKVAEEAYVEYCASSNGGYKVRFLQTIVQALMGRHKILADAGFLPKVGHEREEGAVVEISFKARFGADAVEAVFDDSKSRRKVLEAAQSVIRSGIALAKERDSAAETRPALNVRVVEPTAE